MIEADPSRVLVIDHHATNPGFGGANLIEEAESTTTLIRELFRHLGVDLDYELAFALYAGWLRTPAASAGARPRCTSWRRS